MKRTFTDDLALNASQTGRRDVEITRLEYGQSAPIHSDCISIDELPSGEFRMTGSLLDGEDSLSIVDGDPYGSLDQAEQAGIRWASDYGVEQLYLARDAPGPAR